VAERNDPTEGFSPDAQRAKSGTPVSEDIVLRDYVMLDFADEFVEPSEPRITASDTTEQTSTPPLPWAFGNVSPRHRRTIQRTAQRTCLEILSTGQPPYHEPAHRHIDERFSSGA
jgi:hypothetical protein